MMNTPSAVVILEVMWDWRAMTSGAGYKAKAPPFFSINPDNHSGRRLHRWLKDYRFLVTNACPDLVGSASERGTPDKDWLRTNLLNLQPFDLLLVCGKVAQQTFDRSSAGVSRIIELPHPAARQWTKQGIDLVSEIIEWGGSGKILLDGGQFVFQ